MGRYRKIQTLFTQGGKRYKATTKYPNIPLSYDDIYIYTDIGDRFDILSQNYYGDSSLWWVLSMANPQLKQNTIYPLIGIQIRIPGNIGSVLLNYDQLNS